MSLKENQQNEHILRFLDLLDMCYDGKLKKFSDEFSNSGRSQD